MTYEKGQTLLEALVALGAAIVIISSIVIAVISSLSNAQFSKNQNLANHFAGEGMETVRKIRDASWTNFLSYTSTYYCLSQNSTTLIPKGLGCGQNVGIFVREINIEHNNGSCNSNTRATVQVSWSDNKCTSTTDTFCHKVKLVSCFSNNNAVPTP